MECVISYDSLFLATQNEIFKKKKSLEYVQRGFFLKVKLSSQADQKTNKKRKNIFSS